MDQNMIEGKLAVRQELEEQVENMARRIRDGFAHDPAGNLRQYFQGKLEALNVALTAVKAEAAQR